MSKQVDGTEERGKQNDHKKERGEQEVITPFWERVRSQSLVVVKVPLSPIDLEAWVRRAGP